MRSFNPATEKYVSLATFRRDGREVRTPVWIAPRNGKFYVFSAGDAGKVKRIRANGRVRLAACDVRGKIESEWIEGRGRVLSDPAVIDKAHQALRDKYGWQMKLGDVFAKLSGRMQRRAYLELELLSPPA